MKLQTLIDNLFKPDHIDANKALNLEVEFCTTDRQGLSLLSVYENDGKIVIDIGTSEDSNERNAQLQQDGE